MKTPERFIVTAFWNNYSMSERFIRTLYEHSAYAWHLVVINNGSSDNTRDLRKMMTKMKMPFTWFDNKKNLGCAKAWNKGVQFAMKKNAALIGVLNNDLKFSHNWDNGIVAFSEKFPEEHPVFSPYTDEKSEAGFESRANKFMAKKWNQTRFREKMGSEALFIQPHVFKTVGLFDERFFVTYEDADFFVRLFDAGIKPVTIGSSVLFHQSMASRKKLPGPFELESRAKFVEKYQTDAMLSTNGFRPSRWVRKFRSFKDKLGLI